MHRRFRRQGFPSVDGGNEALSAVFSENLRMQGVENPDRVRESFGSLDMGNVSHVCPAINPYVGMGGDEDVASHTTAFRDMTLTEEAYKNMVIAINATVKTAMDVFQNEELLQKIKDEFHHTKK